ncbi:MAG: signal peptidase I [Verrucomicrobiia bacterium]
MKLRTKIRLSILAVIAGLALIARLFVQFSIVSGESMTPTLQPWDLCLMRIVHHYEPHRGDIVMFRTADNPPLHFIKRVTALPGETISIERGVVKINGAPLAEPYTTVNPEWNIEPTPVPVNKVFVIGDNRDQPREDYLLGLVATRLVDGRLLWYWRLKR